MAKLGYCVPCGVDHIPTEAVVTVDGDPMCTAHALLAGDVFEPKPQPAHVPAVATAIEREARKRDLRLGTWMEAAAKDVGDMEAGKMAGRRRISEEVKAKVRAEYGTMSNEALGRKYGTNGVRIAYICRDLAKPERRKAGKAIRAAESTAGLEAALKRYRQSTAAEEALATLKLPASALDRMWSALDLDNKARAIQYLVSEGMV